MTPSTTHREPPPILPNDLLRLDSLAIRDTRLLVTEDDTPVDNIYAEKQQHLLTEPLYSS